MHDWERVWIEALDERIRGVVERISFGRGLVRAKRVTALRVYAGRLEARVQGSHARPHVAEAELDVFSDDDWQRVVSALAGQARHHARLLAGQVPIGLEAELAAQGLQLLPQPGEVRARCTCDDSLPVCAHVAAAWLLAGEHIAEDPFVVTRLRGRGRQRLLDEVRRTRLRAAPVRSPGVPLGELAAADWNGRAATLAQVEIPDAQRPRARAGPLKVLGDPAYWAGPTHAWELFLPLIERAATAASQGTDAPMPRNDQGAPAREAR